ncbi:MAG: T9SS type A sorting domain-containing protein [Paludibacteraceae bacterium]
MKKNNLILLIALLIFGLPLWATNQTVTTAGDLTTAITTGTADTIFISGSFTVSSETTIGRSVVLKGINSPELTGGGSDRFFLISSGTVVIDGITFTGGVKSTNGGAIYINGGAPAVTIQNSRFIKNKITTSSYGGAAICINPSAGVTTNVYNCVFAHNENANASNGYGGAISSTQKVNTINVVNCTFARNVGGRYGGHHLSVENGGTINAVNCVFWGGTNDATTLSAYTNNADLQLRNNASYVNLTNCLNGTGAVTSLVTGKGIPVKWVLADESVLFTSPSSQPGFAATDALIADYTLLNSGIGSGSQTVVTTIPATDVAGNARVNGKLDIGAYENQVKKTVSVDNANVTISPSGTNNASFAEDFEFTLTPANNYVVSSVKNGETLLAPVGRVYTLQDVTTDTQLTVVAELPQNEITVAATGITVTSPTLTDGKFSSGTTATITFTVNSGYENPVVMVNSSSYTLANAVDGVYTISLTGITSATSVVITAAKKQLDFILNIGEGISGTPTITNVVNGKVEFGSDVLITFGLSVGYHTPYAVVNGKKVDITINGALYQLAITSISNTTTVNLSAYEKNVLLAQADTYISTQSEAGNATSAKDVVTLLVQGSNDNTYIRRAFVEFNTTRINIAEYNQAKLKLTYHSVQYTTRPTSFYVNTVTTENAQTLDNLTWSNSGNQTNIPSGITISNQYPIEVTSVSNGSQDSFELYFNDVKELINASSDGIIRLQLNTTYGSNGGNNIKFHSLENGIADYVPQLVFLYNISSGYQNAAASGIRAYGNNDGHIVIDGYLSSEKATVFNLEGQKIASQQLNEGKTVINPQLSAGLYIVKVGGKTLKVIIK